ncbi:MAG TPA: LLM class flavin-dependent oxidoreductase, partial [Actinomycetota bacterium]
MGLKIGVGLFTGQIQEGSGRTFTQEYADYIDLVRRIEDAGLDAAWVSEHHFSGDGYLPSLLPMLAAFAAVTSRIELGTGVVLAPFHDPIRLAEDFAVVDQISGGRVVCGLGIGWREEEFRAFGIDVSSRVRRTIEIVEILRQAWGDGRVTFKGRHYEYEDVAVTPKPARVPPILLGGFVDDAIKRAGRIADGYLSSRADVSRVRNAFAMAAEERGKAGEDGPPIVGILQNA